MKILVLDTEYVGLDFCLRCQDYGHDVRWFLPVNGERTREGDGLVRRVDSFMPHMKWADLIFLTGNSKYMAMLEPYRKDGFPIFGPSRASAELEINRGLGMEVLQKAGIEVPSFETFKTLKDAEQYVRKTGDACVFKTLGDNEDKSLSYCAQDADDMISRLRRWQELGMNPKGDVMIQEFIPGIEMGVAGWLGPEGWLPWWNEDFEFKKLMSGDKGPNTGEMGTVEKYVKRSKLADKMLKPLTDALLERGHRGDLNINCIVKEGDPHPLELTARAGWPDWFIRVSAHKGDPAQWMVDLMQGKNSLRVDPAVCIGVVIAQPDFPYSKQTGRETDGIPVYGITEENRDHIHPAAMRWGKGVLDGEDQDMFLTAGDYVMVVSDSGETVSEAMENVYRTVDEIHIPNKIYRDDIGERLKSELPQLHKHGFATEFEYGG